MTLAFSADHELAHVARRALLTYGASGQDVILDVAAADDMFVAHVEYGVSPEDTVYGYFAVAVEVQHVFDRLVASHFGSWERVGSVLDFAAGYGRCTRLLVTQIPAERVWVGEVQHDALEFQMQMLGVHAVRSHTDGIDPIEHAGFDLVVVVSLFTHLPRHTWQVWLERLWSLVSPGGLMVFSTHAVSRAPENAPWEDGFAFLPESEVDVLDTHDYGSTFTTTEFVQAAITEVCGADAAAGTSRLPLAFGGIQDVWAVPRPVPGVQVPVAGAPPEAQPPEPTEPVESGPVLAQPLIDGAVDVVRRDGADLVVSGWAARLSIPNPTRAVVAVRVGNRRYPATGEQKRNDVAQHFGRPAELALAYSGWYASVAIADLAPQTPVVVTAHSVDGADAVLLEATLGELLSRSTG